MSFRLQITILIAVFTCAVFVGAGILVDQLSDRDIRNRIDERLELQVRRVSREPALHMIFTGSFFSRKKNSDGEVFIDLSIPTELVLSPTNSKHPNATRTITTEGFPEFTRPDIFGFSDRSTSSGDWRILSRPVQSELLNGRVLVAVSKDPFYTTQSDLEKLIVRIGLLMTFLSALGGWFLSGQVTKPLSKLRQKADSVRDDGDLSARIEEAGPSEIRSLAADLNAMLDRIDQASLETHAALNISREFGASVAHELRTPLTSMRLNLELLSDHPEMGKDEFLEIRASLLQQHDRIVKTLESLRFLSRGDLLNDSTFFEDIDVITLIENCVDQERRNYPDTAITFQPKVLNEIVILGWRDGFEMMIRNLLENARLHGTVLQNGGNIEIEFEEMTNEFVIRVSDHGPGIDAEDHDRLFERFYRGKNAKSDGSGLGLALVKQQVGIHGGEITVDSDERRGTRFTLSFPNSGACIN